MGHLVAVGIEIEAAVVARSGQTAVGQADAFLHVFAVGHVAVERGFDADAPRPALPVAPFAADFAADVDDVIAGAERFDQPGEQIDRVAFGDRIEVELYAGIGLHQPALLDTDLFAADECEDRIDVGMPFGLPAGKPPRFDQRFDRHVVAAAAQGADAVGQMQVEGDMAVYAVRLVAVEPAQQRARIEDRHRRLGFAVEFHHGGVEFLRGDALHVGRDMQRCAEHHAVHGGIGGGAPASPEGGRGHRNPDFPNQLFCHNVLLSAAKIAFSGRFGKFPPKRLLRGVRRRRNGRCGRCVCRTGLSAGRMFPGSDPAL